MSRLDELIAELCPDGVEYKEIQELFYLKNGYTPPKSNPSNYEYGTIPWFRMEDIRENGGILSDAMQKISQSAVKGSLFPANSIIVATSATIGVHALVTVDFLCNQRFTCLSLKDVYNEKICPKFIYYMCFKLDKWCLENSNFSSFASVDMSRFRGYKIPVPPLPVQEEIVRILDTFSELTAELTAELSKRKQQYQYYRNTLVDFKDGLDRPFKINKLIADLCPNGVEYKTLGELATDIFRGSGITRDQVRKSGTPCVRYGEIYTTYGVWFEECVSFTDESIIPSKKYFEYGDILFAITGEKVEDIAKSCVYIGKEKCLIGGDIVVMKHTQNPKYMGYALSTSSAQAQKSKGKVKSKVVHSSIPSIKEIVIPVPPLPIQKEIVAILDRFDALCNDLTSGLPAEIEARKKQYEYYRDKLLTFKEAV